MSISSQQFEAYLPVYDAIPEDWQEARQFIVEQLKKISNAVNVREIGWYIDEEILSGGSLYSLTNNQDFRSIFRKAIDFGTLPNSSAKSVAHLIPVDATFKLVRIWLSATDPIGLTGFSCEYYAKDLSAAINLNYTSTDVVVTTTQDYTNFTDCTVFIEYTFES